MDENSSLLNRPRPCASGIKNQPDVCLVWGTKLLIGSQIPGGVPCRQDEWLRDRSLNGTHQRIDLAKTVEDSSPDWEKVASLGNHKISWSYPEGYSTAARHQSPAIAGHQSISSPSIGCSSQWLPVGCIGIRIGRDSRSFLTERKSPPLHIPKVRATRSTPADANISEVLCCGRPGLVQLFNRLLSFYAALVPDIRRSPVMEELTIENTLSASCVFNPSVDGDDSGGYVIFSTK